MGELLAALQTGGAVFRAADPSGSALAPFLAHRITNTARSVLAARLRISSHFGGHNVSDTPPQLIAFHTFSFSGSLLDTEPPCCYVWLFSLSGSPSVGGLFMETALYVMGRNVSDGQMKLFDAADSWDEKGGEDPLPLGKVLEYIGHRYVVLYKFDEDDCENLDALWRVAGDEITDLLFDRLIAIVQEHALKKP